MYLSLGSVPVRCYGTTKLLYLKTHGSHDKITIKLNTNVKVTVNPKSKVCEINSHGERGVTGLQTLLYRPFHDAPKIMFYIDRKISPISISFVRQ